MEASQGPSQGPSLVCSEAVAEEGGEAGEVNRYLELGNQLHVGPFLLLLHTPVELSQENLKQNGQLENCIVLGIRLYDTLLTAEAYSNPLPPTQTCVSLIF